MGERLTKTVSAEKTVIIDKVFVFVYDPFNGSS